MDELKLFMYIPGFKYKSLGPGFIDKIKITATEESSGKQLTCYTQYIKNNGVAINNSNNEIFRTVNPATQFQETDEIGSPQYCSEEVRGTNSCWRAPYGKFYDFITEHNESTGGSFTHVLTYCPKYEDTTKSSHFNLTNRDGLFVVELNDPNAAVVLDIEFYTLSFDHYENSKNTKTVNGASLWADDPGEINNQLLYIKIGQMSQIFKPYLLDEGKEEIKNMEPFQMYYDITYAGNEDGTVDKHNALLYLPLQTEDSNMPSLVKDGKICELKKDSIFQDFKTTNDDITKLDKINSQLAVQKVTMEDVETTLIDEGGLSVLTYTPFMDIEGAGPPTEIGRLCWWGINKVRVNKHKKKSKNKSKFKNFDTWDLDISNMNILWSGHPTISLQNAAALSENFVPMSLIWVFPTPNGHSFGADFAFTKDGTTAYNKEFTDPTGFFRTHNEFTSYEYDNNFGLIDPVHYIQNESNEWVEDEEKRANWKSKWAYAYRKQYYNKTGGHTYNAGSLCKENYNSLISLSGFTLSSSFDNIKEISSSQSSDQDAYYQDVIKKIGIKYTADASNGLTVQPQYTFFSYPSTSTKLLPNIVGSGEISTDAKSMPLELSIDSLQTVTVQITGHQKELEPRGNLADNGVQQLAWPEILDGEPEGALDKLANMGLVSQYQVYGYGSPVWDSVYVAINTKLIIDLDKSIYKFPNKSEYSVIPMYYTEKQNYKGNKSNVEEIARWTKEEIKQQASEGNVTGDTRTSSFFEINSSKQKETSEYIKLTSKQPELTFGFKSGSDPRLKSVSPGFYVIHANISPKCYDKDSKTFHEQIPFWINLNGNWYLSSSGMFVFYWNGGVFPTEFKLNLTGEKELTNQNIDEYYLRSVGLYKIVTTDTKNINQVIMSQMEKVVSQKATQDKQAIVVIRPAYDENVFNIVYNNIIFPSAFCVFENFTLFSNATEKNEGKKEYQFVYLPEDPKLHVEAVYSIDSVNITELISVKTGKLIDHVEELPCYNKPCRL